jgi:hypothetical protein
MLQMTTEGMDEYSQIILTTASPASMNISMIPELGFNEGHKLAIIVFRLKYIIFKL